MKIVLYGAIGLAVGLGLGTGVSAMKHKKVLTAELVARQDSIAAAEAEAEGLDHSEAQGESESAMGSQQAPAGSGDGAQAGPHEEGETSGEGLEPTSGQDEDRLPSEGPGGAPDSTAVTLHTEPGSVAVADSAAGMVAGEGAPTGPVTDPGEAGDVRAGLPSTPQGNQPVGPLQEGSDPQASQEGPMRLAKIFGAMDPDEAAKVLENLEDAEVQSILKHISDRKVAAILSNFQPARAATLSRVVMGLPPIGGGDDEGGKKAGDGAVAGAGADPDPDSGEGSGGAG